MRTLFTTALLAPLFLLLGGNAQNTQVKDNNNSTLSAKIVMTALSWDCAALGNHTKIDFIGDVTGGEAPYEISWYVSATSKIKDAHRNETDYLEVSDVAEDFAPSPQITVNEKLGYYIILKVSDEAGDMIEKTIKIDCNTLENKVSAQSINNKAK
ncbi:MAG: hypothetical protein ACPGJS_18145 [Flammeovirgaceae bacterium]